MRNRLPVLTVILAGALLSQQACAGQTPAPGSSTGLGSATPATSTSPVSATPTTSATPSKTTTSAKPSASSGGVLSGTRQVYILPKNNEATVAVDKSMNVGLSDDFGDRALFVFTPSSGRYQIKTAKLRVNNDPSNETYCLAVKSGKVVATACDSSDDNQLFYVIKSTKTASDKQAYVIRTKDYVFLRVATPSSNLTATKIPEGTADAGTDFTLPDKGKASLPALD